jgi:hypothetical protein
LILIAIYVAGFVSVIVGAHLFLVLYDPGSVGELYLFPFAMIAPAELLGLLPAWMAARCIRQRPEAVSRIVVAAWGYVIALVGATLLLERRNLESPMLPFVLSMVFKPFSLLVGYGLFVGDGWEQAGELLAVAFAALLPLLILLFGGRRWASRGTKSTGSKA